MKKIKLFLLPALVLAMVASLTAGIVAANLGTKAKVNAEAEKWTVAGTINGWNSTDDTYILTLQEDGVTYKSAAIDFVVGDEFKVLKDNSWSVAYPSGNWVVSDGVGAGTYYVVYNSNTHEVSLEAVPEEPEEVDPLAGYEHKASFNVASYDAGTLSAKITDGIFSIESGSKIRARSKSWTKASYDGFDNVDLYNNIDGETTMSFSKSIQMGSSVFTVQTGDFAGIVCIYVQNGSSGDSYNTQYVKINGTDYAIPGNSASSPVVQYSFEVETNSTYSISHNAGTIDVYYAEIYYNDVAYQPDEDKYYLVGVFNEVDLWSFTKDNVAMVARAGNLGAAYKVALKEGDAFKVRRGDGYWYGWDQENEANNELVTFDGDANGVVKADGVYNVYLGNNGYIYINEVITAFGAAEVQEGVELTANTEIEGTIYTLTATSSKTIRQETLEESVTIAGRTFGARLNFGGGDNAIKFTAPITGAVKVYALLNRKGLTIGSYTTTVYDTSVSTAELLPITEGSEYTLKATSGGFNFYYIEILDADAYAAELAAAQKAATIADGIAEMAKNPGWYVVGKINGGTGDDEIDFAFSTYRGITMATGDNTAEYWGIELTAGDKIKFAYCDGEGHVTYTAGDNAEIAEDGTYNVYCYTGNDSQKYTSAAKVEREDFGIEKLISKTSIDNQYILFVAGITLDKEAAYEGYYIGMCINGTSYGGQKYYTSISLKTGYDEDKQEDIRVIKTVDELFENSNAMIVTEIDFAEINEVVVYVYNGTTIVDSVRYSK